ncbi:MAG TPA: ROK family protein [Gaiellaceae bacterium]|nr:ROK family protein [Gaiellaceae bacterium]
MDAPPQRVIGVDVGGTKILAGVVGPDGAVETRRERPTPLGSEAELLDGIEAAVEELRRDGDGVGAVGFGLPTRVDHRTGRSAGAVNLPLGELDFVATMRERLGLPVAADNDANAAALAEWRFGAGRGTRDMVMLTLGTGVGGGVVVDGRLFRAWAELGHVVVEHDGPPCQGSCTGRGHLEAVASGHAADRLAREAFGEAADAHRLVRLAREGDETARRILDGIGRRLGSGIGSLVNVFNPEVVVIGGGFSAAGDLVLDPAREVVAREALAPAENLPIVTAELGTAAGLIGAALLALDLLAG